MCSKSANYCFATRAKNEGLVLLSEVAVRQRTALFCCYSYSPTLPVWKCLQQIICVLSSVGLLVSVVACVPDFGICEMSSLHNVVQTIQ